MEFADFKDLIDVDRNLGVVWPPKPIPKLPARGARWHALVALRRFLSKLTYQRVLEDESTTGFRIPEDRVHIYTPENVAEREIKTGFAFLPGPYSYDERWVYSMGRPEPEESTIDQYGYGTVLMTLGYYVEQITIEAVATGFATVRGMVEGVRQACRFFTDSGQLYIQCPEYYNQVAAYTIISGAGYSADVVSEVSGRRVAHLAMEIWIPEVVLINYNRLRVIADYGPQDSYITDGNFPPAAGQ